MFYDKSPDPSPLGVRLGDLMAMLVPTSIKATLKDNVLLARHEHYTIRLEVVPPDDLESENGPIQAVVRMVTNLPTPIQSLFEGGGSVGCCRLQRFCCLRCAVHRWRQRPDRFSTDHLRGGRLLAIAASPAAVVHHDLRC